MSSSSVLTFVAGSLPAERVQGRRLLEIGALDVNGSPRRLLVEHRPELYLGVDLRPGPGVDLVCSVDEAPQRFGSASFDAVICTEVLEHIADWRAAVVAMKQLLRPGGALVLTTRSPGFPLHDFPHDHWRFTVAQLAAVFADFDDVVVEEDPLAPGVFASGTMPGRRQVSLSLADIEPVVAPGARGLGPVAGRVGPVAGRLGPVAGRVGPVSTGGRPGRAVATGVDAPTDRQRRMRRARRRLRRMAVMAGEVRSDDGRARLRADARAAWAIVLGFDERLRLRPGSGPLSRQAIRFRRRQRARRVAARSAVVEPWFECATVLRTVTPEPPADTVGLPPTFVGIGAAKCGTTWWYELLAAHPRYHRRARGHAKELLYFDQFLVRPFTAADARRYRDHFRRRPDQLLGEWSPVYLDQPWAAAQLAEAVPEARLLVMLSDPVERVLSDLRMQFPRYGHDFDTRDVLAAATRSRYAAALEPWLDAFPREQVHVVQYEQACLDPVAELARTWTFLGVDDPCPPEPEALAADHVFHPGTLIVPPPLRARLRDMLADDTTALVARFGADIDPALWPTVTGESA